MRLFLRGIGGILKRGLVQHFAEPALVFGRVARVGAIIFALYYGARLIGPFHFRDTMVAFAFYLLWDGMVNAAARKTWEARVSGLLEIATFSPMGLAGTLAALPAADGLLAFGRAVVVLWLAAAFGHGTSAMTLVDAGLLLSLACVCFVPVGMTCAAMTAAGWAGRALGGFLSAAGILICGVFFPRELLPAPVASFGGMLPLSPIVDVSRMLVVGSGEVSTAAVATLIPWLVAMPVIALVVTWGAVRACSSDSRLRPPMEP